MVFRIGVLVSVLMIAAAAAAAGEEPIVTTDLLRIRSVGSIDVARDGSVAVFSVRSVGSEPAAPGADGEAEDGDTRYENREHLFAIDLLDVRAVPRQLTFGSRRDAAPSLAPDGRRLAFVRESETKDEDGKKIAQIWVMDLAGGEARQITQLKHGASRPIWSPDGKRILAAGPVPLTELERPNWPSERPGRDREQDRRSGDNDQATPSPRPGGNREEIRAWLDRNAANHDPYVINRLAFQEEQSLRRNERFVQLLLIDVDAPGAPPVRITNDAIDHLEARFLGTGGRIVYVTQKPTAVHPDRTLERSLWSIDSDGSNDRLLLRVEGFALAAPRPSQDGSMLAFTAKQIDEPAYRHPQLGVIDLKGSLPAGEERRPIWLTDRKSFDGPVRELAWLPARSALIFGTARAAPFR